MIAAIVTMIETVTAASAVAHATGLVALSATKDLLRLTASATSVSSLPVLIATGTPRKSEMTATVTRTARTLMTGSVSFSQIFASSAIQY